MSRVIFDEPVWWQRPSWQIAAAALLTLVSLPIWWAALAPIEAPPVAPRAHVAAPMTPPAAPRSAQVPVPAEPPMPATPVAVLPSPPSAAPAPLSTMVSPGVHVTPLSVPPNTVPVPAGPNADDSEPEN